jgi:hypothetical protein
METKSNEINLLEKNRQLESLLKSLLTIKNNNLRLGALGRISTMDLGKYDLFPTLKKLVLEDPNSEIRIFAIKILHKQYPKKSEGIIKIAIKNEDYFDIPIIVSGESTRYNINDLISYSIEKMKYGDIMVNEIFNTELFNFLLDWKHYRDKFHIYYDIMLQCYILIDKLNQNVNYLCSTNRDLFSHLKTKEEIRFEGNNQNYSSIFYIFTNTFHTSESKMRIVNLSQTNDESYPTIKIIDEVSNISCYVE